MLLSLLATLFLMVRYAHALDQRIHALCVNARDYVGCVNSQQRANIAPAAVVKYDNYTLNSNYEIFKNFEKKILPKLITKGNGCIMDHLCYVNTHNSKDQFGKVKPFRWIEYSTGERSSYLYPFPEGMMTITKSPAEMEADRYLLFTVIRRYLTEPTMGTPGYTIGNAEIDNDCKISGTTTIRQSGMGSIDINTYGTLNLNEEGFFNSGIYRGYGSGSLNSRSTARVYGFDFDVNSSGTNRCRTTVALPTVVSAIPGDPGGRYEQDYGKYVVNCLDNTFISPILIKAGYTPKKFATEMGGDKIMAHTAFGPWFYKMCQVHIENPNYFPLSGIDPVTGKRLPEKVIQIIDRP